MFALNFVYMCGLGIWLGSLITIRYIVPAVISRNIHNRESAAAITLVSVQSANKLGAACGISMIGSLILQELLKGEISVRLELILIITLMMTLLGIGEIFIRNFQQKFSLNSIPKQYKDTPPFPVMTRKLIPMNIRMIILAQIVFAFALLLFSL